MADRTGTAGPMHGYDRSVWERQIVRLPRLRAGLNFWRVRVYEHNGIRIRYYPRGRHFMVVLSVQDVP